MKKKLTFPLLVLVLLLWGAIFFRVFSGLGADTDHVPVPKAMVSTMPTMERTDDDTLLLNYRDPFLSEVQDEPAIEVNTLAADDEYVEEIQYVDWSQVQYLGSVNNSGSGKAIALVRINGREYMLTSGETVDGFTLVSQRGNAATMSHQGQVTTLVLQGTNGEQYP